MRQIKVTFAALLTQQGRLRAFDENLPMVPQLQVWWRWGGSWNSKQTGSWTLMKYHFRKQSFRTVMANLGHFFHLHASSVEDFPTTANLDEAQMLEIKCLKSFILQSRSARDDFCTWGSFPGVVHDSIYVINTKETPLKSTAVGSYRTSLSLQDLWWGLLSTRLWSCGYSPRSEAALQSMWWLPHRQIKEWSNTSVTLGNRRSSRVLKSASKLFI